MYFLKKIKQIKIFLLIAIWVGINSIDSSLDASSKVLSEFVKLNHSCVSSQIKSTLFFKHSLQIYENNNLKESYKVHDFFKGTDQLLLIKDKGEDKIFLNTQNGYWVQSARMRSALKISGNFKAHGMDVQDIFRIDFQNDYKIIESKNGKVYLERTNTKISYPFLSLEKKNQYFEGIFMDKNQRALKRLRYFPGNVSGFSCFQKVAVVDLIFHTDKTYVYAILSIQRASLPSSFFRPTNMMQAIPYFEKQIK